MQNLDELNRAYFEALCRKREAGGAVEKIKIHDPAAPPAAGVTEAFPTAIAPPELMAQLPHVEYSTIRDTARYRDLAAGAVLWIKKMQAGSGSSLVRASYLAKRRGIPLEAVKLGAKGTDLFVEVGTTSLSLAEIQLLQGILDARAGKFFGVVFHDIVSSETREAVQALWRKPSFLDPARTYAELAVCSGETFQAFLPTIDQHGKQSLNRTAPGGHALFGMEALRAAWRDGALPPTSGRPLISVVGNGEDLSSSPDPAMVGWMIAHQAPIVMVTTEKTANDMKGGQSALARRADGGVYATIIEQAQAKEAGQLDRFERLGLDIRRDEQTAFFNTNMALFNYDELAPRLGKLRDELGEQELLSLITPDLIENWKEQKDADGVTRKYLQLEGAMGSSLLNLDRFWRKRFGAPLIHFINVDRLQRTRFFSPIKNAFDFFLQFRSDRFRFNPETMRLENLRPDSLPLVSFKDQDWQDLETVLDRFQGAKVRELDSLSVEGPVSFRGARLAGKVSVRARPSQPASLDGKVLRDVAIEL
jgi:hypothetical protein